VHHSDGIIRTTMPDFNKSVIDEFHANQGKVSGPFAEMELLLLTTVGAKTGKASTNPLAYTKDGDRLVIVASKGGAPTNPDWYYNLVAHPEVTVELGTEKFPVRAILAAGKERERLFDQHAKQYPGFNDYKAKTTRELPVFALERV
ncbi:MAG TPA: nitroreductase family deazaflavin-dependent oxidoreductase, partial [Candidatus Saccharimonadales bacterium]|nr:nitroreductase family deazaflavin-dependent oxidoreductase [Candidatus Saccharimonadales bacterium]